MGKKNTSSEGAPPPRDRKRPALLTALMLYVLMPMCLLLAGVAWWGVRIFEETVEAQMQRDLELVAKAIRRPLSHAMLRQREGSIAEALRAAFELSEVYGVVLYDPDGRRISSPEPGKGAVGRDDVARIVEAGESGGAYGRAEGREVYSYFLPLTEPSGRISGLLELTRRRSDFARTINRMRGRVVAGAISGFALLGGLVVYGHHMAFGRSMRHLVQSMATVAGGRRAYRHAPDGPRELMRLGSAFNRMLDQIDLAEQEILARKDSEEALEAQLRQAEKLAAIGELAAGVAHELGTPLSVIDARTQRGLRDRDLADAPRRSFEAIRDECRRMQHIIRQLLDFSRPHSRTIVRVDTADAFANAVAAVTPEAEAAGIVVTLSPGGSPAVDADPVQLEQALVNLLRNAIQASRRGPVEAVCREEDGEAVWEVRDDGPGVDPGARTKIFEPFYTTKSAGGGTGLGLAVVHGIATEHGGKVQLVPSTAGACFQLRLPAAPASSEGARHV